VRKQTENDAISQKVLLNLRTLEEQETEEVEERTRLEKEKQHASWLTYREHSQAAYLKP
jgi:hypothetical protein